MFDAKKVTNEIIKFIRSFSYFSSLNKINIYKTDYY